MAEVHLKPDQESRRLYMVTCEHKDGSQCVTHLCGGEEYFDPTEEFCVFVWAKDCLRAIAKARRRLQERIRKWPPCKCLEWRAIRSPEWRSSVDFTETLLIVARPLVGSQRTGEVGYSLLPLDVGFDLRAVRYPVGLPDDCETRGVAVMLDERPYAVWGKLWAIVRLLRRNGYKVRKVKEPKLK